jgi:LysM repeat protein
MRHVLVLAALAGLGACSSLPQMPAMPKLAFPSLTGAAPGAESSAETAVVLAPLPKTASAREHVSRAIELLNEGRREEARAGISEALAKSSKDATALRLLEQIDKDPVVLLGEKSEPYVVAAGDTMSGLAARFIGDPLMFYALARYNGLASPKALSVGQTLKIPSRSGVVVANALRAQPEAPAKRPVNAGKANTVRLDALEKLNAGDVSGAITLFTEAQALDETNVAIAKDLERARRIQSALTDS